MLPFENDVVSVNLNRRDSVMTNAAKLAAVGGGGTNCSAPLRKLANEKAKVDLVVFISDNQSWVDAGKPGQPTAVMTEWARIKRVNPAAKLVCLDIQPYATTQAPTQDDVLNIGGFSDAVYGVITSFAANTNGADGWVRAIEAIEL